MASVESNTPKWILVATSIVGLLTAVLVLVARYYEVQKARDEAAKVRSNHEQARKVTTTITQGKPAPKTDLPTTSEPPVPKSNREPDGGKVTITSQTTP